MSEQPNSLKARIERVAVVGTGLVGCGWSAVFALGGAEVRLYDARAEQRERALAHIKATIEDMERAGLASDIAAAITRVSAAPSLAAALDGVDYVQESVFERVDVKTAVAFRTGEYAPDFHAIATESTVILPWDREILVDGELVPNPRYADAPEER